MEWPRGGSGCTPTARAHGHGHTHRVGRIPSADDEDEVERLAVGREGFVTHLCDRILAHLRGVADRVEGGEVLLDVLRPIG